MKIKAPHSIFFILISVFLMSGYIFIFSYLSIVRFLSLGAHYYDLGIMDQTVYNTSQGRILELTHPDTALQISRFAIHFDPILALFAPFYRIYSSPIVLLVGQSIILGLGGLAVLLIAMKMLKSKLLSLVFLFLYLNYYPLQLSNMFDFHAVTIATTTLLFAFYFLVLTPLKNKLHNTILGIIFIFLTLLTKESAGLTILALCAYLYIVKKEKRQYLLLGLFASLFFIFTVFVIIPHFAQGQSFALNYYDYHHPFSLLRWLFSLRSIIYIIRLALPFGLLSLLSPLQFMITIPELFLNLLSSNNNMRALYYHYTALITPFIAISAIYGMHKIIPYINRFSKGKEVIGVMLISLSIYFNISSGYTNFTSYVVNKSLLNRILYWQYLLKNDQIKVSTTGSIAPFFTQRQYLYNFFFDPSYQTLGQSKDMIQNTMKNYTLADYVIIYKKDIYPGDELRAQFYRDLRMNKKFKIVENNGDFEVYIKMKSI